MNYDYLEKCNGCQVEYPAEILWMGKCGICGLREGNEYLGIERKKFNGETAEYYRLEAIKWRRKKKIVCK